MLSIQPADAFGRRRHGFGCTDICCAAAAPASSSGWSVSRSLEAATSHFFGRAREASPAANLRSSGPPRVGWRTPEKPRANAGLTRSLPLTGESQRSATCAACELPTGGAANAAPAAPAPAPTISVVDAACRLLERVVGECLDERARPEHVFAPIFHSVSVPGISGGDYLRHHLLRLGLARKEHLSDAIVLHAFLLIDRLLHAQGDNGFHLCTRNVHRVLLATTLVSAKLLDDECYNNSYWAQVGGVALPHLNQLEVECMTLLNFNLLVNATSLEAARGRLLASA